MFKLVGILALIVPLAAWADTGSDTVPTNLLVANWTLIQNAGTSNAAVSADLEKVGAVNGVAQSEELAISKDESIMFTGGGQTVAVTNNTNPTLPFVAGGTYTFQFKRFNGENYKGSVAMPNASQFLSPAPGSVFAVTDNVHVTWTPNSQVEQIVVFRTNCEALSNATFDQSGTGITFPAGIAANCQGTPEIQVDVINAGVGSGFGTLAGATDTTLSFSYKAGASMHPLAKSDIASYVHTALQTGQHVFIIRR